MTTPAQDKLTEPVAEDDIRWIDPTTEGHVCPECQTEMGLEVMYCPQCELPTPMSLLHRPPRRKSSDSTFSLSSLILLMTLFSFVLAVFSWEAGLGIFLTMVVVPAMIRTLVIMRRVLQSGRPLTNGLKIETFVVSVVVATIAWGACGLMMTFVGGVLCVALNLFPGAGEALLLAIVPAFFTGCFSFFFMFHYLRDYSSINY